MDSERKVFNNNPKGNRLRGRSETDGGAVYKQILINSKLQIGKGSQTTELTGRSPFRRRRSVLDCSAIEEEEL